MGNFFDMGITAAEIELAIARWFDSRRNLIVPNVWWGMGLNHECDLIILTKTGYAYEIEIKISKADLKRDRKKRHNHKEYDYSSGHILRRLYFAIPKSLESCIELIPERAGILMVEEGYVKKLREAKLNPHAHQLGIENRLKLAELGTMRIWTLKRTILDHTVKQLPLIM